MQPAASTATVTAPAVVLKGTPAELTATVGPKGTIGLVDFLADGKRVAGGPVVDGVAKASYTPDTAGDVSITARYLGSGRYLPSTSAPASMLVRGTATRISVSLADSEAVAGDEIPIAVNLTPAPPTAQATVFVDGVQQPGTVTLSGGSGRFSLPSTTTVGTHTISARFAGQGDFHESQSVTMNLEVVGTRDSKLASTVSLTAVNDADGAGAALTASVWPKTATGNVEFLVDGKVVASQGLADGTARFAYTYPVGDRNTHSVVARYVGDAVYRTAQSASEQIGTVLATTGETVKVTVALDDPTHITITAKIEPKSAVGTMVFKDAASTVDLGSQPVVNGVATLTGVALPKAGWHVISAVFEGEAPYRRTTSDNAFVTVAADGGITVERSGDGWLAKVADLAKLLSGGALKGVEAIVDMGGLPKIAQILGPIGKGSLTALSGGSLESGSLSGGSFGSGTKASSEN